MLEFLVVRWYEILRYILVDTILFILILHIINIKLC